jgi:VanZ family protein
MLLILGLGSDAGSATNTGALIEPTLRWLLPGLSAAQIAAVHVLVRATAHIATYGILAGLWARALTRGMTLSGGRAAMLALAVSLGWALLDESLQGATTTRTSSAGDVLLDASGALGGILAWAIRAQRAIGAAGMMGLRGRGAPRAVGAPGAVGARRAMGAPRAIADRGLMRARSAVDAATRLSLLVAAIGGVVALLVNAVFGVPSGILWVTVPVAAGWLLLRLRRRSRG